MGGFKRVSIPQATLAYLGGYKAQEDPLERV